MGSTEAERTPLADNEEANFNPPPKYDAEAQNESEVEKFIEEKKTPIDEQNLVFLIILLHGIGTLMPWNMFINIAPAYYKDYKMMDRNETGHLVPTSLSENFPLYLSLCSQLPNLLLNFINIFITVKGDLTKRISMSLSVVALTVIATMCFIYVDTETWRIGFCVLTLATIVVLNSANGIYQNCIYGVAADFPFKYTNAVITGNNACGTFVAVVNIIAFMLIDDVRGSAFLYFSIALITLVVCFSSLFTLKKKKPFYVFYHENSAAAAVDTKEEEPMLTKQEYIDTFKQGWPMFLNVFLVFFVTLTCFSGLLMFVTPNLQPLRLHRIVNIPVPRGSIYLLLHSLLLLLQPSRREPYVACADPQPVDLHLRSHSDVDLLRLPQWPLHAVRSQRRRTLQAAHRRNDGRILPHFRNRLRSDVHHRDHVAVDQLRSSGPRRPRPLKTDVLPPGACHPPISVILTKFLVFLRPTYAVCCEYKPYSSTLFSLLIRCQLLSSIHSKILSITLF